MRYFYVLECGTNVNGDVGDVKSFFVKTICTNLDLLNFIYNFFGPVELTIYSPFQLTVQLYLLHKTQQYHLQNSYVVANKHWDISFNKENNDENLILFSRSIQIGEL